MKNSIKLLTVFCFLTFGAWAWYPNPAPAQETPSIGESSAFLKFTARGTTPDQALNRAFAKAGVQWGQPMDPGSPVAAIKDFSFSVMVLPESLAQIEIIPPPVYVPIYQAWVVVRYRVALEGEGK